MIKFAKKLITKSIISIKLIYFLTQQERKHIKVVVYLAASTTNQRWLACRHGSRSTTIKQETLP